MNHVPTQSPECSGPQSQPHAGAQPAEDHVLSERMQRIGRRLFVLSGKGGVGKSTVAVNLAVALARRGRRVGLLDVDVHGPSIPTLLGLAGRRMLGRGETLLPLEAMAGLKVVSLGLLTDSPSDAVVWRGPRKNSAIRQLLRDVDWGDLDELVVDCPPGTGDEPLGVVQLSGRPGLAVVVTTPQEVAVADVRRCLTFCRLLDLPIAGIVENMSGMVCPHCGQTFALFGEGGGERLAREAGVPLLGRIPLDPAIGKGGDAGLPFASQEGDSPTHTAFKVVLDALLSVPASA
ncbi:MAG TPA: Mrp/NBP35 family ATP-binding protein [Opitutaceae bacterium]|nr:Mrp/NBP35 family ATP-binding protein [Opitutaceae bacterium]